MKIAIVDDSSSVRLMINMCLDEIGISGDEISEFESAVDAIEDFKNTYYDLIFCDLIMPEMSGYELIKAIAETLPEFDSSRIIMVSGEEDPSYKRAFKEFGVHQFIKKPIQPASFLHHIKPLIAKAQREFKK